MLINNIKGLIIIIPTIPIIAGRYVVVKSTTSFEIKICLVRLD